MGRYQTRRHRAADWRLFLSTAGFLGAWALVGIWLGWRPFATITMLSGFIGAILGGYCYRHDVVSSGRPPRFRWLVLEDDVPPGPATAGQGPSNAAGTTAMPSLRR